jgi:hypothetical protein
MPCHSKTALLRRVNVANNKTNLILLKRMQLAWTAWVEVLDTRDDCRRKTDSVKNISFYHRVTFLLVAICLLSVSFITSLKSNLYTSLIPQNTTEKIYYLTSIKHDCTSAQCVFNRNTMVKVHMKRMAGFPWCKPLPLSLVNSKLYYMLKWR